MLSTSDGEKEGEEGSDSANAGLDFTANAAPTRQGAELPDSSLLHNKVRRQPGENTATSQTYCLSIKETNQQLERRLACTCQNFVNPELGWNTCVHPGVDSLELCLPFFMLYSLTKESSLMTVLDQVYAKCKRKYFLGLILVHYSNSTILESKFWDTDFDRKLSVCVMSHEDGQSLLDQLQRLQVGEVCVSLSMTAEGVAVAPEKAVVASDAWHLKKSGSSTVTDYLEEATRVKLPVTVTRVLPQLQLFEESRNATVKFLCDQLQMTVDVFVQHFVSHLAIVYRILSYEDEKQCHEYIEEFMKRTEQFLPNACVQLAVEVQQFRTESSTIAVAGSGTMSFSHMLCVSSQELLKFTRDVYPVGHLGLKMLWVYLELMFRSPVTSDSEWLQFIQNENYKTEVINQEELDRINGAIQFGMTVKLCPTVQFSGKDLVDMLVDYAGLCLFVDLRWLLHVFEGTLFQNKDNLLLFSDYSHLVCIRLNPRKLKSIVSLGSKRDLPIALEEGVSFIADTVLYFGEPANEMDEASLISVCTKWWESLMEPAMVSYPKEMCSAMVALIANLKGDEQLFLPSSIQRSLTKVFLAKFEVKMKELKLKDFVEYYCSLPFITKELVKGYLGGCREVPPSICSSEPFTQFMEQFFQNYPRCESVYHKMFLDIIKSSSRRYDVAANFIRDVMSLQTEHLLLSHPILDEVESANMKKLQGDFARHVWNFVHKRPLPGQIVCTYVKDVVVSRETLTPVQKTVVKELFRLVPLKKSHFTNLDSQCGPVAIEVEILQVVLAKLCEYYKTQDSWCIPPTVQISWYWGLIDKACQLVKPPAVHLDNTLWCKDYQTAVRLLADVYSQYRKHFSATPLQSVPDVVEQGMDEHMKRYFQWVKEIWKLITFCQDKIKDLDWTESQIKQYAEVSSSLDKIATALHIEALAQDVECMQMEIQKLKEAVKCTLLHSHPAGRCSVLGVLHKFNIAILPSDSKFLSDTTQDFYRCLLGCIHYEGNEDDVAFDSLAMKELTSLHEELRYFLGPIGNAQLRDFMVHFSMCNSKIFAQCMKVNLQQTATYEEHSVVENGHAVAVPYLPVFQGLESHISEPYQGTMAQSSEDSRYAAQKFHKALEDAEVFLKSILLGDATFHSLFRLDCFQGECEAVTSELSILQSFTFPGTNHDQFKDTGDIKSILQLIQLVDYIASIHSVCDQYHISGCLCDEGIKRLLEIRGALMSEEEMLELNVIISRKYHEEIRDILCLKEENWHALSIFAAINDSADFYQFLKEKRFEGKEGATFFMQQHALITEHLLHEEYNEQVLNHLVVAFRYVLPFLGTEQSLPQLMDEVYCICGQQAVKGGSTNFVQLRTVNENIYTVRLWFSRAEGDTLENIAEDLKCLLLTGHFEFVIPKSIDIAPSHMSTTEQQQVDQRRLLLHYEPFTPVQSQNMASDASQAKSVTWNREQIEDFTRKLGFLEKDSEDGSHIKFQRLSAIAQRAFEVQCELADLSYPEANWQTMECLKLKDAELLLEDLDKKLSDWREKLKQMYRRYDKLLFFHIPKMLRMSKMLHHGISMVEGIPQMVQEVSFLFDATVETRQQITSVLKDVLKDVHLSGVFAQLPIDSLGKVLKALFQDKKMLHKHYLKRTMPSVMKADHSLPAESPSTCTTPWKHCCVMHVATDLKPKHLIRLIFEIYQGIPAPYEVHRCRANSTEEELMLFFQRILKFPYLQFCLLDINMLPLKLQEVLLQLHLSLEKEEHHFTVHYIRTGPCILEDMPWVTIQEHKPDSLKYEWNEICVECGLLLNPDQATYSSFELVYGRAGVGKTHYIQKKMKSSEGHQLTVVLNESFSVSSVIQQLRQLPLKPLNALYLSFALLPASESSEVDQTPYQKTMSEMKWFLLDLFFLGYVEDPSTGQSFSMPSKLKWVCYCEVPSREGEDPVTSRENFVEDIPVLELVGKCKHIQENYPFEVDSDVQYVCNYLKAYERKDDPIHGINKLYKPPKPTSRFKSKKRSQEQQSLETFMNIQDLSDDICHSLLANHMPREIRNNKMYQKMFIGYMKRRCTFLQQCPGLIYNEGKITISRPTGQEVVDTSQLGSTIMKTMLEEVGEFCNPQRMRDWSDPDLSRLQLVYEVRDQGGCFHLIAVNVSSESEELEKYRILGANIPTPHELATRECLDKYLASALDLNLEDGKLKVIDDHKYVLTLDYTLKILDIHERFGCGVPVIIEGETGVGKTALVEMISKLWNESILNGRRRLRDQVLEVLKQNHKSIQAPDEVMASYRQLWDSLEGGTPVLLEDLEKVCSLSQMIDITISSQRCRKQLPEVLRSFVQNLIPSTIISLLDFEKLCEEKKPVGGGVIDKKLPRSEFPMMMKLFATSQSSQATAGMLFYLLRAQPRNTFYKLSVHAALTPKDYDVFFQMVFKQATDLGKFAAERSSMPRVTVFLDEINTSSCMGLLKEVLVDHTFFGQPVPSNIFIVAACNPHRGNSMIPLESKSDSWVRSSYNVRCLHPTIRYLVWDYGALSPQQEEQYIKAKMKMTSHDIDHFTCGSLSALIIESQTLMRRYAEVQLREPAHSCVSQRDIQRVFTLYEWLLKCYRRFGKERFRDEELVDQRKIKEQAVLVALGIVYYLRLNQKYRSKYIEDLKPVLCGNKTVEEALKEELDFYSKHLVIPSGIAKTDTLMENMFCIIACCCTKIPLIIVGAPGSSKTLSFNLALANIKGAESKSCLFRDCNLFPSMDPHFYQCSRNTTSVEVETVFQRAITRQAGFDELGIPINCVVFMDEAGLPEESHESLKVLHKYLDSREVSFVAISNHLLDAAKTNRAASLFRTSMSDTDMKTLARDCVGCKSPEDADARTVDVLCEPYQLWITKHKWFKEFFGLRDFIHMIHYLHRRKADSITPQLVLEALERNFNGCEDFDIVCQEFLKPLDSSPDKLKRRGVIEILQESLRDKPNCNFHGDQQMYNDVRYKLIFDPSEDDSLSRLLLMHGILEPKKTKVLTCSAFPEDGQLQKINTIAAIRHAAVKGQTVLMSQTDDILDSFYDLFNQHFRRIDYPDSKEEPRFYANIAIGSHHKLCRVHKDFQCVVIVRESELPNTPSPFLNRFEKYFISHKDFLDARMHSLPPCLRVAMQCVLEKVHEFFNFVGESGLYGAQKGESVQSLALSILPFSDLEFMELMQNDDSTTMLNVEVMGQVQEARNGPVVLLTALINTLQDVGFHFSKLNATEIMEDAAHIFKQLSSLPSEVQDIAQHICENYYSDEHLKAFVRNAVNHLHLAPAPENYSTDCEQSSLKDILQESSVVVMVMVQWLVLYMSKRLLQLMTAEALILSRKWIPDWCLDAYLTQQSHFSLKELINNNLQAFQLNSSSVGTVPAKLMCFTRSTPNIHRLPAVYPTLPSAAEHKPSHEDLIKEMITDELTTLYLCKLSNILTEQAFQQHVQSFMESKDRTVMLLVINMQETTKQKVNHIRILVDQAPDSVTGMQKFFVLLLHFPSSMLYNPCYPALFLNGWDHHYLDSVQPEGIVDIGLWFRVACQQHHSMDGNVGQVEIVKAAQSMIPSSVAIISSRVSIGSKKGGSFNSIPANGSERVLRFKKLLSGPVGVGLCRMYARYWQPNVMAQYLEKAVLYSKDHTSSLSITDSVRDFFQTAFHNFLAYMVNLINEDLNLDVIVNEEESTLDLFLQLMELLPQLPKLAEVKAYNNTWPAQQARVTPSFPFFRRVVNAMDQLMEMSVEKIQTTKKALTVVSGIYSSGDSSGFKENLWDALEEQLVTSLESGENPLLQAAVAAIGDHDQLWEKYWQNFMASQFHLNEDKLTIKLLDLTIARPLAQLDSKKKLVMLHTTAMTNQVNLAKLVSSLRPFQKLQEVVETMPAPPTMSTPSANVKFMSEVEKNPDRVQNPETLHQFIIDTLFEALAGVCLKCGNEEMNYCEPVTLKVWRDSYRDVTLQTSVKEILFHSLKEKPYIAKLNSITAVFFLLQVRAELDEEICDLAIQLGKKLLEQFFSEELQLMSTCPRLTEIVASLVDVDMVNPNKLNETDLTSYLENLLTFFFSSQSKELEDNDVIWFLHYVNSLASVNTFQDDVDFSMDEDTVYVADVSTPANERFSILNSLYSAVAKKFLGDILTHPQGEEKPMSPLHIFHGKARMLVAQVLLHQHDLEGQVGTYLPLVYRQCTDIGTAPNPRMEQPLADLYFLVVMEHLAVVKRLEPALQKRADVIKALSQAKPEERSVLYIELQATVQIVLRIAAHSVADRDSRDSALTSSRDITEVVQHPETGGERGSGHQLVFMMHLLKELNGPTAFLKFLHESHPENLPFLTVYNLTNYNEESSHLFPFMLPDAKGCIADVYRKVKRLMMKVRTDTRNAKAEKALVDGLTEITRSETLGEPGKTVHTKRFLRMVVWLVVYYQFYPEKMPILMDIIDSKLQFLGFSDKQLRLLKCFLLPDMMEHRPESPLPLDVNEAILSLGRGGQLQRKVPKDRTDQLEDPIYKLFNPPERQRRKEDPSDVQLRHALANLIAVTFSLPPRSTHLWYFLFDQSELEGTYLPGFRYPHKVSPETMFYDCGVLLNEDGQFDRPDYHEHSSPLTLHSFYLLEWATFGVLCMALLTNPEAEGKIHGHIISEWQPLRHFCMQQLRHIWLCMCCNLDLSDEKRSFLIVQAMHRLFQNVQTEHFQGKYDSQEEVRLYECQWHYLYEARFHDLGEKLRKHSHVVNDEVFKTLSIVEAMYPRFPTERQCRHNLESLLGDNDPDKPKYFILSHFMDNYERLAVGSALLPNLVEMYLWLDLHLAYLLPYEDAMKLTLSDIKARASERYPSEANHINNLYKRLTETYNQYVQLNKGAVGWGCVRNRNDQQAKELTDSTPVIRLLSTDDSREGRKNDWLCLVMKNIIAAHNNLVQMVATKDASFNCWLQSTPPTVDLREFSTAEALVCNSAQLRQKEQILDMIRSRHQPAIAEDPPISVKVTNKIAVRAMYDFGKLESDVVRRFIAGKPFIDDVDTLRKPFRFRDNAADSSTAASGLAVPGCPVDLAALSQELHESCKIELTEDKRKGLEAYFHSASYNVLSKLVAGLRTAAGYLHQYYTTLQDEEQLRPVLEETLMQFLRKYFGKGHPISDGLKLEGLKDVQLQALETLPVAYLYKTLEMFVGWVTDCLYDFHELSIAVKKPLPTSVHKWMALKLAHSPLSETLEMVKDLENTVSHIEHGLHRDVNPLQPLREYLITTFYDEEDETPLQLVPADVLLQHYMHFVVLLRNWKLKLQSGYSLSTDSASPSHKVWVEMMPDVWAKLSYCKVDTAVNPPASVKDHNAMMTTSQAFRDDHSSEHQDTDRIWLDSEESMESKIEVSLNEPHSESSVEDSVSKGGATAAQGDGQLANGQSLLLNPSKEDSHPGLSSADLSLQQYAEASLLAKQPSERAKTMTAEEVVTWLEGIGFSKYTKFFHEVDGETLSYLDHVSLEELGVKTRLDRVKILLQYRKIE